ncbi:DUF4380 domain-containing protein [Microbulbifer harenosus]|uniref:DUF4380 domain-containing protein n=1 Tax=Microbulbifer harenosus TaxID=2576840 RepID=A0ABY2UK10_9GAMM|nr:DUF4380 domain-containing protein [Microbulbifer harenosus]TLM78435.1 DUF4380 domain-containing protein [Microbulbifer harenosus]
MLFERPLKKSAIALGLSALLAASASSAEDDTIRLSKDSLKLALDPNYGGRITELWYGDRDLLAVPEPGENSFGSTFWLSPQTLWNWPPIPEHDTAPYAVTAKDKHSATVTSAYGGGARISKTVTVNNGQSATVHYRIDADKDFPEIAAWEITRVPSRGLAFAPVTTDSVKTVRGRMAYELENDALWLPMEADAPLVEGKVVANGTEGWLAYAVDGLLYLKLYPKVAMREMASGEGDIELYLSGELPFLELEVQSAARRLQRGQGLDWSVEWLLLPLPEDLKIHSGSPDLLAFVREQIKLASPTRTP